MRRPVVLLSASILLVVLLLGGTVLILDSRAEATIPKGVTVGGVDVGGMSGEEARRHVDRELLYQLRKPVRVTYGGRQWTLTAEKAKVAVHVDEAIDEAVRLGETGNAFSRVYRRVTGGEVDAELDTSSSYSRAALTRLLDRVEKGINRSPKDASVSLDGKTLEVRSGRSGVTVRRAKVAARVRKALLNPSAPHRLTAATTKKAPKVTTAEVRKKYDTVLVADRGSFKLTLYKNLKPVKTYGISVGKAGHDTPSGQYTIANKDANPAWHVPQSDWAGDLAGTVVPAGDPGNPIKARWMGIYDGVGIHGTSDDSSIGTNASHGCLRMHVPDVIDLFPRVPVDTPIWIL